MGGREVMLLSERAVSEMGLKTTGEEGLTTVYVLVGGEVVGWISLSDEMREGAKEAVEELKGMNLKVYMLTGDREGVAKRVAEALGLDGYFFELLPHEKVEKIGEFKGRGMRVAMVGDGINDAPALVSADLGIAIGAGTDVAMESADVVLVRSDPRSVPRFLKIAERARAKMKQNLLWATGYNVIAMPLAAGVFYKFGILLSPAVGAVLMSLSTIIVAINSARLRG